MDNTMHSNITYIRYNNFSEHKIHFFGELCLMLLFLHIFAMLQTVAGSMEFESKITNQMCSCMDRFETLER